MDNELKSGTPILMCSVPGFDASGRVDDLAAELGRGMTSIAIGSEEGFAQVTSTKLDPLMLNNFFFY